MPVVFVVTPNPVPFTQSELNQKVHKAVTIKWDTGSASTKARVFKALNGAAALVLPVPQNISAKVGTATDSAGYSDTAVYTLRDATNKILAAVTSRSVLVIPPPPTAPPRAFIYNVRIIPRGDTIWLTFNSTVPCAPWVELLDTDLPPTLVGLWARSDTTSAHAMKFDGINGPLKQDHPYMFRIVLDKNKPMDPHTNPSLSGMVTTGSRTISVTFTGAALRLPSPTAFSIYVPNLDLHFAAGDVGSQTVAGRRHAPEVLYPGSSLFLSEDPIVITRSGPSVWAYAMGQHIDTGGFGGPFATDLSNQPFGRPDPGQADQSGPSEVIVSVGDDFASSPASPPGPDWSPVAAPHLELRKTLNCTLPRATYDVLLRLDVDLTDGSWHLDAAGTEEEREYRLAQIEATTFTLHAKAFLHGSTSRSAVELTPSGDMVVSRRAALTEPVSVILIRGPAEQGSALALDDDRIHIAAIAPDRELRCLIVGSTGQQSGWGALGLTDVQRVATARIGDAVHVVAQTGDHRLMHATHYPDESADWTELAHHVRSFAVITSQRAGTAIVAVHDDGSVAHTALNAHHPANWQAIDATRPGEVSAVLHQEDSSLSILVQDDRHNLRLLAWPDYPSSAGPFRWRELGTSDDLIAGVLKVASRPPNT